MTTLHCTERTVMKCWTNDIETVIAADLADARVVWHEQRGGDIEDFDEDAEENPWRAMPDDEEIRIHCDNPCEPGEGDAVAKTASEWAKRGRGFLCSDEY